MICGVQLCKGGGGLLVLVHGHLWILKCFPLIHMGRLLNLLYFSSPPLLTAQRVCVPPPPLQCSLVPDTSPPSPASPCPPSRWAGTGAPGRIMSFWLRTVRIETRVSSRVSRRQRSQTRPGNRQAAFKMTLGIRDNQTSHLHEELAVQSWQYSALLLEQNRYSLTAIF